MGIVTQVYRLRESPELTLILKAKHLSILDKQTYSNDGEYLLRDIKSIRVAPRKVNWFVSVLSFVFSILLDLGNDGMYKNKSAVFLTLSNGNQVRVLLYETKKAEVSKMIATIKSLSQRIP